MVLRIFLRRKPIVHSRVRSTRFKENENGRIVEIWPSLAIEKVHTSFDTGKPSRSRAPNKTVNEE